MELLERDATLAALEHQLSQVRSTRSGRLALVTGEAGGGKTALVRALMARHDRVPVLVGACAPLFTPRALAPLLGLLPGIDMSSASAAQAAAALARSITQPTIVVLEDLHWADEATLDVVSILGRRLGGLPALVVATFRDDELGRDHPLRLVLGELSGAERIPVRPFSLQTVARLAASRGVDGESLYERTAGNPFFVTEVLAHSDSQTPSGVRDAVLARAARLPPDARHVLDAAAIARPRAEVWLLEHLVPDELSALATCLTSGMLQAEDNAVRFRHEIARATIEDAMPPDRRVALHRGALAAMAGHGDEARLAHHAEAAADGPAMLLHGTRAAEQAARLGAHREAAAHYEAVLERAGALPTGERADLYHRRSFECFLAGMLPESLAARERALVEHRLAGDRYGEGDDERWLSRLNWYLGNGKGFRECAGRAVAILSELPPGPELAMAYSTRAAPPMFDYDVDETVEWGGMALRLAEELGQHEVVITAIRTIGTVELSHGLRVGIAKVRRSLDLALAAGMHDHAGVAYSNLVSSALTVRDYDTAQLYLEAGREFCDAQDLRSWGSYLDAWGARFALDQGRWDEASALAEQSLERAPRTLPHSRFVALLVRGVLAARTGRGDPWGDLDEALAIARGTNELQRIGPAAVARAETHWLTGSPDRIPEEASQARSLAARTEHSWTLGELALWLHRAGLDPGEPELLPAPVVAELAGDFDAAASFWSDLGCRYDAALVSAGCETEAVVRSALGELQALGARPAAAIVVRRLRERGARGVRTGPRASTRGNPSGLTARQMDVLGLLVEGKRNAEIASQLFLSEKTVGHHVSAILLKLGVSSRTQAAREALRLGLAEL